MPNIEYFEERATPDAVLSVGAATTLYIGTLGTVGWHKHGAPVFISGLAGSFGLRLPNGEWTTCRSAVIPAGVSHALELRGDPLAVFYPEPNLANMSALFRFLKGREERDGIVVGRHPDHRIFRELYEDRTSVAWSGAALDDVLGVAVRQDRATDLDSRLLASILYLQSNPDDLDGASKRATECGLSTSRFLHLFSEQVGVPFRRYRIWSRVRRAINLALSGKSFTDAAMYAGFSDSAHFSKCFRDTFGVTPTYVFGKLARAGVTDP